MIVKRTIKEQQQEYEYKGKSINYDTNLHVRMNSKTIDELKSLASYLGYKDYAKLVRDIINSYLDRYEFIKDTSLVDKNDQYIVREVN